MADADRSPAEAEGQQELVLTRSPAIRMASTFGIASMALVSVIAMVAALCWSLQGLLGLPNWLASGAFVLLSLLGVWTAVWVGLRNWHVEKRLERGLEIDEPKWSIRSYLQKGAEAR
ncbi:hypothetical protein [Rhodoligotrophos defluvii]|uniref:hypothetical protein n=1 Tax=Rhodoligotrophos defluvii TaxID=2561934 RepID=UPI0010C97772|nr:hypothetical protein [Rhodoligotrophos defluvii]